MLPAGLGLEYFAQVCPPQIFVTLYAKHILEAAHALFGSSAPPSLVVAPLWKAIFAATDGRNPSWNHPIARKLLEFLERGTVDQGFLWNRKTIIFKNTFFGVSLQIIEKRGYQNELIK